MRMRTVGALLMSAAAAWVLSGWLTVGISYLHPVYVELQVSSDMSLTFSLSASKDGKFPYTPQQQVHLYGPNDWHSVRVPVPPHQIGYLYLGFRGSEQFKLRNVLFNGQPLDLVTHLQMRNVRLCTPSDMGEITFIVAEKDGSIIFSPDQLPAVNTAFLWKWQIVFFVVFFLLCGWLCNRYTAKALAYLRKNYPNWLLLLLFICLLGSYSTMRWYVFYPRFSTMFFDPEWTQFILLLQEQMLALVFLSGMLWLGFRTCNKWVKSGCILAGTILVLTEWADAVLLWLLNERFSPGQIGEFGGEVLSSAWPFLKSYFSVTAGQYTLLFLGSWIILCVYLWRVRKPIDTQLRQLFGVVMVLGFLWYLLPADLTPAEKNQLVAWPRLWLHSKFPVKTITARVPEFQLTYQCADGLNSRQNVVIIVVESLSAYMSSYFSDGKANNWTPQLDKLAKQYASFTDYRATHPYTAQNLFSILTGIPAVHTYGASYLYRDPRFYRHTLAKIFQEDGYHTAFFTSAAVACSKDEILNRIGFDEMSNNTDIFYNGKKRFTFQSVADDVLYARAQEWMAHYNRPNPYLLILETTTTHPPYIDPLSGEKSLEKNVRYADNALGKFIADLAQKHILDNTLVLITSDHRSNTPLDSTQTRLFGPEAEARIPLVIIGSPLKGKQNGVFAHNDLAPSLAYLTLSRACFHPYQHNMFSPDSGHTSCTLFQSGIEKDTLLVNCQGKYGKIALVEDENVFHQGGQLSDEEKSSLLGFVNWIRDNGRY